MRKGIFVSLLVAFSFGFSVDAKACQGCCWDSPYYTARCCNVGCGSSECRVQATSLGPYCVRSGSCAEDYWMCYITERALEYVFARCEPPKQPEYALISVKVKRPSA